MKALYENAPLDFAIARRPEVFPVLCDGYRLTVAQGHKAFEIDAQEVVRDWSNYVEGARQPITLVHGRHDPVVRIDTVRDFARRNAPRASLREVEDEGQLLFYTRPDLVLDCVDALARRG
jgi:pimeloyl-ACP methyl ester carboxylesterase